MSRIESWATCRWNMCWRRADKELIEANSWAICVSAEPAAVFRITLLNPTVETQGPSV